MTAAGPAARPVLLIQYSGRWSLAEQEGHPLARVADLAWPLGASQRRPQGRPCEPAADTPPTMTQRQGYRQQGCMQERLVLQPLPIPPKTTSWTLAGLRPRSLRPPPFRR